MVAVPVLTSSLFLVLQSFIALITQKMLRSTYVTSFLVVIPSMQARAHLGDGIVTGAVSSHHQASPTASRFANSIIVIIIGRKMIKQAAGILVIVVMQAFAELFGDSTVAGAASSTRCMS